MTALSAFAGGLGSEVEDWTTDADAAVFEVPPRATAIARAALLSASLKAREIQQVANAVLADARAEGESIVNGARATAANLLTNARSQADTVLAIARREADAMLEHAQAEVAAVLGRAHSDADMLMMNARMEAEELQERSVFAARQDAEEIVDRALVHRELLLSATLERIATLSSSLIDMSEQMVSHAEDPAIARAQLAHFMLVLTDMAEQVGAEDPEG